MAWIHQVPIDEATGELKKIYDGGSSRIGGVANIIRVMYFDKSQADAQALGVPPVMRAALWLSAAGILIFGVFPNLLLGWAEAAATVFKF